MMIIKYSNAEFVNIVEPIDVTDEDTKQKLDDLRNEMKDESLQDTDSQEQK